MKKIKWLGIITSIIIVGACSPNDIVLQVDNSPNTLDLVSITENTFDDNLLFASRIYRFHQGILQDITYLDGSYDLISYSNGLMTQIDEFDSNNTLTQTRTYVYDAYGRLINKTRVPIEMTQWDIELKEFSYEEDRIIAFRSFYDHNNLLLGSNTEILTLNANNLIIREESADVSDISSQRVEYFKGNPSTFFYQYGFENEHNATITYSFSNNLAADEYHLSKYMFGEEWKNNTILNKQFNLDYEISSNISDNYLMGYSYKNNNQEIIESLIVEYEFNSDGKLARQIRLKNSRFGGIFKTEFIYEYQ